MLIFQFQYVVQTLKQLGLINNEPQNNAKHLKLRKIIFNSQGHNKELRCYFFLQSLVSSHTLTRLWWGAPHLYQVFSYLAFLETMLHCLWLSPIWGSGSWMLSWVARVVVVEMGSRANLFRLFIPFTQRVECPLHIWSSRWQGWPICWQENKFFLRNRVCVFCHECKKFPTN